MQGTVTTTNNYCCPTRSSVCQLPRNDGSVCTTSTTQRWYFSTATKTCQQFNYGGCNGNRNNFATQTQCQGYCNSAGMSLNMVLQHVRLRLSRRRGRPDGRERQSADLLRWSIVRWQRTVRVCPVGDIRTQYLLWKQCTGECPPSQWCSGVGGHLPSGIRPMDRRAHEHPADMHTEHCRRVQ